MVKVLTEVGTILKDKEIVYLDMGSGECTRGYILNIGIKLVVPLTYYSTRRLELHKHVKSKTLCFGKGSLRQRIHREVYIYLCYN